ncbi:MAG: globin [Sulfuricurvum sp.]
MTQIVRRRSKEEFGPFPLEDSQLPSYVNPVVPFPSVQLYLRWGEEKIRQLVRYHHCLLRLSDIPGFLPDDQKKFEIATEKTADFFVEVLSRGRFSKPIIGYPALKMRYFRITVDEYAREVWLHLYRQAVIDMKMPSDCIEDFWNWIEPLSIWMINRKTGASIRRYPYSDIWTELVEWKVSPKKAG